MKDLVDGTAKLTIPSAPGIIGSFRGQWGFLSNFSAARVKLDEEWYPTVEHAFQAAKVLPNETYRGYFTDLGYGERRWRWRIRNAPTPATAKHVGRQVPLRPDWNRLRVEVMRDLLLQKFSPGRVHLNRLLATGDAQLVEGNTWHDNFWGACGCGRKDCAVKVGENMLGQLLMEIRAQRRTEQHAPQPA